MNWEALSAIGSFLSAAVIAASAIAALVQIRHLRAGNQLAGFLQLRRELHSDEIRAARAYVNLELAARLADEGYRQELISGIYDPRKHPEILLGNFWAGVGSLIRHGVLDTPLLLDFCATLCKTNWRQLEPVAELLRRREPVLWEEFEYLAKLCDQYLARRHHGAPPPVHVKLADG